MNLAIIIINYKTPNLVIDCLSSLQDQIELNCDSVVVVDNASGDNSVEQLETAVTQNQWQSWVKILPSQVNGGFSAGNNLGIQSVSADAYLLLNSDTLVRPGAIATLKEAMQAYPEAGLISPRLEWPDGTPQISCFRYHSPLSELINAAGTGPVSKLLINYDVPLPVSDVPMQPAWTSFACVLIRREVIERVGLMDEGYFMYFDDVDYCHQARDAGWSILHFPSARVVHLRGGSGSVKKAIAKRQRPKAYLYASRARYFRKFYGHIGLLIANLLWLVGRSISFVREVVGSKEPHACQLEYRDIWLNWKNPMVRPNL